VPPYNRGVKLSRSLRLAGAVALFGLTAHCGSPPCQEGETCDDGSQTDGGNASTDSGSGNESDSGSPRDGGGPTSDGGGTNDGGSKSDGGAGADAGGFSDGGSGADGGTSADGGAGSDGGGLSDGGSGADGGSGSDGGVLVDGGSGSDGGVNPNPGGCVSGAVGTHVARFRWAGNGPSSRAYVQYEANNLPDAARWKAGAYSRGAIGYNPVFTDTFLGVGGLEMGGTVFVDVELSTAMLSRITKVTLSVFGRSFNTTASGSFEWMSFDGAGAAPSGLVSNVAPYKWYSADATTAFRPGNGGVLLRISPAGPSGTLVVNKVELCFETR
jgi:hypothetical protein